MPDLPLARFRGTIHYDGSDFRGWQLQPAVRTVQGDVESSLSRLTSAEHRVTAAGRTDTGVHAVGQEISFDVPPSWQPADLHRGLNALLPNDIWIERLGRAADDFHPRFDALARRYEYLLDDRDRSPILGGRVWNLSSTAPGRIDEDVLAEVTRLLPGDRSFHAFSKAGQPDRGTRCTVDKAVWSRSPAGLLHFTIVADRFLHRMVRYLVSTLVEVATGRRNREELERLLAEEEEGVRSPVPAPPWGLYLTGVRYPNGWNRPPGVPGLVPHRSG